MSKPVALELTFGVIYCMQITPWQAQEIKFYSTIWKYEEEINLTKCKRSFLKKLQNTVESVEEALKLGGRDLQWLGALAYTDARAHVPEFVDTLPKGLLWDLTG